MAEFGLPPSDEPFDFRHQASLYGRYRPQYSPALHAAIEARPGQARGRIAVDVGCGTGFVTRELVRRGWRTLGIDFSAPMLAEARRAPGPALDLVRARGEALPVQSASATLFTSGTAFHWLAPTPALEEICRVLEPGGWVALFWRYDVPGEPSMQLVAEVLERFGSLAAGGIEFARALAHAPFVVHPPTPFAGARLLAEPELRLESVLEFTPESFHGYIATLEWIRRLTGARHAAFLDALREEAERRYPSGFSAHSEEYLFLAQKPRRAEV
jgi:SAM-dependent methyltransferase